VGYVLLEVAGAEGADAARPALRSAVALSAPSRVEHTEELPPPPHDPETAADPLLRHLLRELALIWHDYRSKAWRTPIVSRIARGSLTHADMLRWMEDWIPQVQQGSVWMRKAVSALDERYADLRALVSAHANDEQYDFRILFADYRRAGGARERIEDLRRNPGGEALNAYLHARAERPNPVGLLGAIYIIEGTGQRVVPALLPQIRRQLGLPLEAVRFLHYHGENDVNHLARWLRCAELALQSGGRAAAEDIIATARNTAALYLMQLEAIG
jgi:3-oxoacyl-[acyl-carrier-protein] synthase-3